MAIFSKPPAKKPGPKPDATNTSGKSGPRAAVSARDVAVQAQGRRGSDRPRPEPSGEITVTGASLIEWSPVRTSIEVAQANPGLCAVLENAALLYASGQAQAARESLIQGVQVDHDAKISQLAWLALFDLLQRANARADFDQFALQYVVQFERSAPPWEEDGRVAASPKVTAGSYVTITGKLTAASAPQIDTLRLVIAKKTTHARLDLAKVAGFDDTGARMLAEALAEARKRRFALTIQHPEKVRATLDILIKRGKEGGEGAWLLSLELLQFAFDQQAFEDRAIEYAIAFEQSPPSWEPPVKPAVAYPAANVAEVALDSADGQGSASVRAGVEMIVWTGVMTGAATQQMARVSDYAYTHPVVPIDVSDVERIDFVCAGALLNAINRVEQQRRSVQVVGASPIIRALLLLIGISPRHFVKKP